MEAMMNRLEELWCKVMHDAAMWPMHGRYECRTCGREYAVAWEDPANARGAAPAHVSWKLAGASK
jgi:hypothetical protein